MLYARTGLVLAILAVLTACTVAQMEKPQTEDQVFTKPIPRFPGSELARAGEGWVLIAYIVPSSGIVSELVIKDSSGSDAFERAALNAVREWRYAPGEERELSVLLNFVYDRQVVRLSRRFMSLNKKTHGLIDDGDLDAAQALLAEIRADDDLTTFELAYSFLTEGRVAGERADPAGQLQYFRRAMLNKGRWLSRDTYLACLRATVILAIEQGDFVSAVRDYELLTETKVGMKLGSDLEGSIDAIRAQFAGDGFDTSPYTAADSSITVKRDWPKLSNVTESQTGRSGLDNRSRPPAPPKKGK